MKLLYFLILIQFLLGNIVHGDDIDIKEETTINELIVSTKKDNYIGWEAGFKPFEVNVDSDGHIRIKAVQWRSDVSQFSPEARCGNMYYQGSDKGEWKGELKVTNSNSDVDVLIKENIYHLFKWGDNLYVFTGIQHGESGGGVYLVNNCSGNVTNFV